MSAYHKILKQVEECRCENCGGLGTCDDAEPGDIYYNTWECTECKGSGLNAEVSLDIVMVPKLFWYTCEGCGDMYERVEEFKPVTCHNCGSGNISKLPQ